MPPKKVAVSFPGLLKRTNNLNDEDGGVSPPNLPSTGYVRRSSALAAESNIGAMARKSPNSTSARTPQASTVTPTTRRRAVTKAYADRDGSDSTRSEVLGKRAEKEQVSRPSLQGRTSAKRTKYAPSAHSEHEIASPQPLSSEPLSKTAAAIRSKAWRAKQKENATRRVIISPSEEDEEPTMPPLGKKSPENLESVDDILSRPSPPDEPEYISNATIKSGFNGFAPLIGGTTMEEKARIEQELWEKGKLHIPERYHPEYIKAKGEDPGNFNKQTFYANVDPEAQLSVAGVDEDPLVIDPPGNGGPFDALKFPDRLVEQLNRDDGWTIDTWGTTALNKIPAHLMVRVKGEVLAKMPDEVLRRQQQPVRDKPAQGRAVSIQILGNDNGTQPVAPLAIPQPTGEIMLDERDALGRLLSAPMRGEGGKFLTKELRYAILTGSARPPVVTKKSATSKARKPATPSTEEPKSKPKGPKKIIKKTARVVSVDSNKGMVIGPINKNSSAQNASVSSSADTNNGDNGDDSNIMESTDQCTTCKKMKVKCNGEVPQCYWCQRGGFLCSFDTDRTIADPAYQGESSPGKGNKSPSGKSIASAMSKAVDVLESQQSLDLDPVSYKPQTTVPKGENGAIASGHGIGYGLGILSRPQLPHDPRYRRSPRAYTPYPQEENFITRPSIRITIPDHLKNLLVDDWENVTKSLLLVPVPSQAPANYIIDSYFEEEKMNRLLGSAEADILEEFCAGLKVYFEKSIGKILLYRFERSQLAEVRKLWESGRYPDWENRGPGDCYGAEHLTRMLVNMPELIAQTNMDAQSVARLKEEISKFCVWLARNSSKYFVAKYEKPSAEYIENAR